MDREIGDLLRELAEISEYGVLVKRKKLYHKFFQSLTLNELANIIGFATALKETGDQLATKKFLKGDE